MNELKLTQDLIKLGESLQSVKSSIALNEALTLNKEIGEMLQTATTRFMAARKGLGLANRLQDPDEKRQHQKRVMKNMNALRMLVKRIEQML